MAVEERVAPDDRAILDVLDSPSRFRSLLRRLDNPRAVLVGFVAMHLILFAVFLPWILNGSVLADLGLYRQWGLAGLENGDWVGITEQWVYPVAALIPITLPAVFGGASYLALWLLGLTALDAVAVWGLVRAGRRSNSTAAAWWFMAALVLLSPVGFLRLEGVTAPLVVIGLLLLRRSPVLSGIVLSVATWIKVWPVAVVVAVIAAFRRNIAFVVAGALVSFAIVGTVWALGGLSFLSGFVTVQDDRAMQIEAPASTPLLWMGVAGVPGVSSYENTLINTREIVGPGDQILLALMTPLLAAAALAVVALILRARVRGADQWELILIGGLAIAVACIVLNKVGSPQYQLWLLPTVAVALVAAGPLRQRWRFPAALLLVDAFLTTLVFPILYWPIIDLNPYALTILTARNLLTVLLLAWCLRELWRAGSRRALTV